MSVSIVIPLLNERENVLPLHESLTKVLETLGRPYEILMIDDGSTDGTDRVLRELAEADQRVKVVRFRRNFGQTAAMRAGFQYATGEVVVAMDGDLQNDPADIPMMLDKLDEGYDVVHGWRKNRKDAWLSRKLPSKIANWLISKVSRFPINDLGCTLKAMRLEIARELELYGEMHRFIPILAHWRGARCVEVVTRHHPRLHGTTKYGIGRTTGVLLDLVTVKYMLSYFASPMKLFGRFGICCGLLSVGAGAVTVCMKVFGQVDMTGNPLLLLTVLSLFSGVQFLSLGLLGELSARIYFGSTGRENYAVRELLNFDSDREGESPRRDRAA